MMMVRRPVLLVVGWPVPPSLTPPGVGDGPKAGAGGVGDVYFIYILFKSWIYIYIKYSVVYVNKTNKIEV